MSTKMMPWFLAIVYTLVIPRLVECGALEDQIYTSLSVNAVSRLLNSNGQIGSSTPQDGAIGALYKIDSDDSVTNFESASGDSYVALISTSQLAKNTTVQRLLRQGKLKGMLLYDDGTPTPWSADNRNDKLKGTLINPRGGGYGTDGTTGLHWVDINIPIFMLSDDDNVTVLSRYETSKDVDAPSRETLGVELKFFQWAVSNSMVCLRRTHEGSQFCQQLGGRSVGGMLAPIEDWNPSQGQVSSNKSFIVVAAQMDAISLFHDNSWGGAASAAALAGFNALARMVTDGKTTEEREAARDNRNNIVFLAFQGEQFDNIGSSRFMTDIRSGSFYGQRYAKCDGQWGCNIKGWIELSQMLITGSDASTKVHYHNNSLGRELVSSSSVLSDTTTPANGLPQSSIQRLREWGGEGWSNIDAVVIGDFDEKYSQSDATGAQNYRYTQQDNAENLGITNATTKDEMSHLCSSVCAVARFLQVKAFGAATLNCTSGSDDMNKCQEYTLAFLQAMLIDQYAEVNITASNSVSPEGRIQVAKPDPDTPATPLNRYTSVYTMAPDSSEAFMFWHLSAALAAGTNISAPTPENPCDRQNMDGSKWHNTLTTNPGTQSCFRNTTTYFWSAKSPGISSDGMSITDSTYSTWAESTWDEPSIRIFYINDDSEANTLLGAGLSYFALTVLAVRHLTGTLSQASK